LLFIPTEQDFHYIVKHQINNHYTIAGYIQLSLDCGTRPVQIKGSGHRPLSKYSEELRKVVELNLI